jgi:hypothetical protein
VRHAGLGHGDAIVLSCTPTDQLVRVEVEQASAATGVRLVPPEERDTPDGGFGLRIVQSVASAWDVAEGPPGRVWFEVERDI